MSVALPVENRHDHVQVPASVAVAMSGGVDSSVAAALLLEQGYSVVGLTMHLWSDPKGSEMALNRASGCCSITMSEDAAQVAVRLGFRHYVLNLSAEFHASVVTDFAEEYFSGRTPNPCVRCNSLVKWQALLQRARRMGFDRLATGHYARVENRGGRFMLRRARYPEKDQSYALWGLRQEHLAETLFPLGELEKSTVRDIASRLGLVTADKPESQDICFVPDNDYRRFLHDNFASELCLKGQGEVIGPEGTVLGYHDGVAHFTVGQRKGLGISHARPLFVKRLEQGSNRVFVDYEENCFHHTASVHSVNWVSIPRPAGDLCCDVKVRYRDSLHPAIVTAAGDTSATIRFLDPVRAVTPGQSAVFYDGDLLLGGGVLYDSNEAN